MLNIWPIYLSIGIWRW